MKNKKIVTRIFQLSLFLILIVCIYAYKEYHRKNLNTAKAKPAFIVSDINLINEFSENQNASNKKYLGKLIEISGNIKKIDTDEKGFHTVILGPTLNNNSVRCSIDSSFNTEIQNLVVGSTITIKGICTGYNADDLGLGSDIILNRSIAIKK